MTATATPFRTLFARWIATACRRPASAGWLVSLLLGLALVLAASRASATEPQPEPFRKGDTVCIVGDSITHGGRYHAFLYLFYATRFPDRGVCLVNSGISGDSAGGAFKRLDWDILVHRPTAATVMLGMNDVGRTLYGKDKTEAKHRQAQQATVQRYAANMTKLVEGLKKANVRVTLVTPSIYEQNADTGTENLFGCNDGLANCALEVKKIAQQFGFPVIDLHSAMDALNRQAQKSDPNFTLVGKDRVHPGEFGHFVMAYLLLKAQGVPQYVSQMAVAADSGTIVRQDHCRISQLQASASEVAFDCLEAALPFPVPPGAEGALELVPFQQEMNQEVLKVTGLAPGTYTLAIDGQDVGQYDAASLAAGVNLACNPKTPQYQQALEVSQINATRHSLEAGRLRTVAAMHNSLLNRGGVDLNDPAAVEKALAEQLETRKSSPQYNYFKGVVANYRKYKPTHEATVEEVKQSRQKIYQAAQPKSHHFVIRKGA